MLTKIKMKRDIYTRLSRNTYKVIGFTSLTNLKHRTEGVSEAGISVKRKALKTGRRFLGVYPIVEIHSSNGKFTKLLRAKKP